MLVCQWHLDIPFGKQREVLDIMNAWHADSSKLTEFKRAKSSRVMVGHLGASASHMVAEHEFETMADWEAALAGMASPQFKAHAENLAPYVVPGSQHWVVYRVVK